MRWSHRRSPFKKKRTCPFCGRWFRWAKQAHRHLRQKHQSTVTRHVSPATPNQRELRMRLWSGYTGVSPKEDPDRNQYTMTMFLRLETSDQPSPPPTFVPPTEEIP